LAYLFVLLGLHDQILEVNKSPAPYQKIIDITKDGAELDQWYETNKAKINKTHLLWLALLLRIVSQMLS